MPKVYRQGISKIVPDHKVKQYEAQGWAVMNTPKKASKEDSAGSKPVVPQIPQIK